MLRHRVLTALVLVALFFISLYYLSHKHFAVLLVPVIMLAGWEWIRLIGITSPILATLLLVLQFMGLSLTGAMVNFFGDINFATGQKILLTSILFWFFNILILNGYPKSSMILTFKHVWAVIGLFILCFAWLAIICIMALPNGKELFLLCTGITIFADVGGYFGGRYFGRKKLAPLISPGKTQEGVICALVVQIPLVFLFILFGQSPIDLGYYFFLAFFTVVLSIFGDLFVSMLKRNNGVKDSGSLLPGHGGILDRVDGLIVVLPFYCICVLMRPI
ncbi:MAG: hypothetical protein CBC09_02405 [Cellvibrionales bacterium TMED49]|nr:MAG: hypothetical protein CBC09_02405 [Cellvibrionales bacterium TMED49]